MNRKEYKKPLLEVIDMYSDELMDLILPVSGEDTGDSRDSKEHRFEEMMDEWEWEEEEKQ